MPDCKTETSPAHGWASCWKDRRRNGPWALTGTASDRKRTRTPFYDRSTCAVHVRFAHFPVGDRDRLGISARAGLSRKHRNQNCIYNQCLPGVGLANFPTLPCFVAQQLLPGHFSSINDLPRDPTRIAEDPDRRRIPDSSGGKQRSQRRGGLKPPYPTGLCSPPKTALERSICDEALACSEDRARVVVLQRCQLRARVSAANCFIPTFTLTRHASTRKNLAESESTTCFAVGAQYWHLSIYSVQRTRVFRLRMAAQHKAIPSRKL